MNLHVHKYTDTIKSHMHTVKKERRKGKKDAFDCYFVNHRLENKEEELGISHQELRYKYRDHVKGCLCVQHSLTQARKEPPGVPETPGIPEAAASGSEGSGMSLSLLGKLRQEDGRSRST